MPRLPRINLEGAIYYVTSKGAQNQELFKDKADYKMYLELLAKYKKEHKFKLFSYCLMPERLELLIETSDNLPSGEAGLPAGQAGATISEIMHDLTSLYTKYFNARYKKHGHLFDARFKSVLVEKANALLKMTRHIHQSSCADAKSYPYSSFHFYVTGGKSADVAEGFSMNDEVQEVLNFLKDKDNPQAYERYCLEGDPAEIEALKKSLKRGWVLGSETFEAQVKNRLKEYSEEQKESLAPKTSSKLNPVVILMIGLTVLVATPSTIFLYISKKTLENKYQSLLKNKEADFLEKTHFENQSPIALTTLENTEWTIEVFPLPADPSNPKVKDTIRFKNGAFSSEYFTARGFNETPFVLTQQENGVTVWETAQLNLNGDRISWRGVWRGDVMKGVAHFGSAQKASQDFLFFSVKWGYVAERGAQSAERMAQSAEGMAHGAERGEQAKRGLQ